MTAPTADAAARGMFGAQVPLAGHPIHVALGRNALTADGSGLSRADSSPSCAPGSRPHQPSDG